MRVKTGFVRRRAHKDVLRLAKGYRMARSRHFRSASEATLHAGEYAFAGRKRRKREARKLWILRINAAARIYGFSYHQLMRFLKKANIAINRKMLAYLAAKEPEIFREIVGKIKQERE